MDTTISQPLQRLLEQYQLSSLNSLRGPSAPSASLSPLSPIRPNAERPLTVEKFGFRDSLLDILASMTFRGAAASAAATATPAVMTPRDHSSERHETLLEGEIISCFNVGGEKRMCLPQILSSVLRDYDLQEIHKACAELHIYCSPCSQDQLEVLKLARVMPISSTNCSLVTKTDAERLCNYLSYARRTRRNRLTAAAPATASSTGNSRGGLPVYHECFGRCRGRYFDDKYTSLSAECIACDECGELFAPDRFVLHSHRDHETKVCHWGFDSANWRAYLHLTPDVETDKDCLDRLKNMKSKFYNVGGVTTLAKRALDGVTSLPQVKRPRYEPQLPFVDCPLPAKLQTPVQQQAPVSVPSSTLNSAPLPPLLLCDPLLIAYYHALTNVRLNSVCSSAYPPPPTATLFPLASATSLIPASSSSSGIEKSHFGFSNNGPTVVAGCSGLTAVEEAAAALLKLAPAPKDATAQQAESKTKQHVAPDSSSFVGCNEPLKKHILHRTQSKQHISNEKVQSQTLPLNSSSHRSSLEEDTRAIDALLRQYIADSEGLHIVQLKLDETRRLFDAELDSLLAQNNILQQEIAYLRNKQTTVVSTCGSAAGLTTSAFP